MGRWKNDGTGNAVWDPNDTGPNQVDPNAPPPPQTLKPGESGSEANDWTSGASTQPTTPRPPVVPTPPTVVRRSASTQGYNTASDDPMNPSPPNPPDPPPPPPPNNPTPPPPPNSGTTAPPRYEAGRTYNSMAGWDDTKLNDLSHQTAKYDFARAMQTLGGSAGSYRGHLGTIASFLNGRGYPNAKAVGDDKIDFGDGYGPIDVITGGGEWWWGPQGTGTSATANTGNNASSALANIGSNLTDWKALLNTASPTSVGSTMTPPGTGGIYGSDLLQQIGQDPFSQLISGSLAQAMTTASSHLATTPQDEARAMENARLPYETARQVQLKNARASLANRGTLSETTPGLGLEADALGRIETGLAPSYTFAINQALTQLDDQQRNWATTLLNGATSGTERQQVLSTIALESLKQNEAFNEFVAKYNLDRDKTLYDIQNGQNQTLILLLHEYLNAANISAGGFI